MPIPAVEPPLRSNLLVLAREYGEAKGLKPITVSKVMFNDQDVLKKLTDGAGSFTVRKYDDWVARFRARWPKGIKFPRLARINGPRKPATRRK